MTSFPISTIFVNQSTIVLVSGPHTQILNSPKGDILSSTSLFKEEALSKVLKAGPVKCSTVDESGTYLATTGDDKILKVWKIDGLQLLSERELPKKPTALQFTADAQNILVADKFGDVFRYTLNPSPEIQKKEKDALSSHENPSGGDLILGHVSLLTSFLLSPDEKYIITADRDEHIRISWYPQGYNIESYCLGHQKFVSAIHIPEHDPSQLVSGGGDSNLKVWDWMQGKLLHEIEVFSTVEPFIKVKAPKWKKSDEDFEEGNSGQKRRKRGKRSQQGDHAVEKADAELSGVNQASTPAAEEGGQTVPEEETKTALAIQKINSVQSGSETYVVFTAVGTTAVFVCPFPSTKNPSPSVTYFDLEKPVLDFTITENGNIWVSIDISWSDSQALTETTKLERVRILQVQDGKLSGVEASSSLPIAVAINTTASIPATPEEISKLDLYQALTSWPKNVDAEHNAMDRDFSTEVAPQEGENPTEPGSNSKKPKGQSKKELGRLKSKQVLAAQAKAVNTNTENVVEEGREVKRAKSSTEEGAEDVAMQDV